MKPYVNIIFSCIDHFTSLDRCDVIDKTRRRKGKVSVFFKMESKRILISHVKLSP